MLSGIGRRRTVTLAAVIAAGLLAQTAAASVMLTDQNATAVFDLASPAGLNSWTIDGIEQLKRQWFWYRVGPSGPEQSIDSLTLGASHTADTNMDGSDDGLFVTYAGAGFQIDLTFLLMGGSAGSRTSDLFENIRITNTGGATLDFHFFQYVDFDLGGDGSSNSTTILDGSTAYQTAGGLYLSETVVGPSPSRYQADFADTLFSDLTDAYPSVLSNNAGPVTGDTAWAFEWDKELKSGQSLIISKDKNVVPEPVTMALLGAGAVWLIVLRRRGRG